jgi:hypothetical protein
MIGETVLRFYPFAHTKLFFTARRKHSFLIKIDAVTGVTQWGRKYGPAVDNWSVEPTDVAADPVTGNVFIAGARPNSLNCASITRLQCFRHNKQSRSDPVLQRQL